MYLIYYFGAKVINIFVTRKLSGQNFLLGNNFVYYFCALLILCLPLHQQKTLLLWRIP